MPAEPPAPTHPSPQRPNPLDGRPTRLPMADATPTPVRVAAALPAPLAELAEIYRELDAEIARHHPVCRRRGLCCDFDRVDHVLYASHLEMAYLERHVPTERLRAVRENRCPLLVDGLCTAREGRMLGCRTYFCQPGWEPIGAAIHERALARIRAIARRHDLGWHYAPALEQMRHGVPIVLP